MMYHNALLRFHIAHALFLSWSLSLSLIRFVATTSFCHAIVFVCPISFRDKSYFLKTPYIESLLAVRYCEWQNVPYRIIAAKQHPIFFPACFTICNFAHGIMYSSNGKIVLSLYFLSLSMCVCVSVFVLFSGITYFLLPVSLVFVSYFPSRSVHIAKRSSFGRVNEISCPRLHRITQHRRSTDFFFSRFILLLFPFYFILFWVPASFLFHYKIGCFRAMRAFWWRLPALCHTAWPDTVTHMPMLRLWWG